MRSLIVLLSLIVLQIASTDAFAAGSTVGPRVVLGVDPKGGQRYMQLTDREGPVYPSADITCDGNRRTVMLTRSNGFTDRIVSTYVVPPKISEGMLRAVECRLLIPGREIALGRQQIRAAWSGTAKAQKH
jgi:hypothetical protein